MSDITGIEISDILGLSEPLKKLVETVSVGIGKIYEPCYTKRMAKAKSKEIELISNAISNCITLPIKYQDGSVSIDATEANALVQRAQNRFLFQEIQKQQHIETVVAHAYANLENEDCVAEEPVNTDWITRFFDSVATIGDEDMQILWGKILAGEVKQPGSFSLRTLETVKNVTKEEAELFYKLIPLIFRDQNTRFLLANESILTRYNFTFDDLLRLRDCGLVDTTETIFRCYDIIENAKVFFFHRNNVFLMAKGKQKGRLSCPVYPLSLPGRELFDALEKDADIGFFIRASDWIWEKYSHLLSNMKVFEREHILQSFSSLSTFNYEGAKATKEYRNRD